MTVYVVQKQIRYNPGTGKPEPRFPTIAKAEKYGDLEYCLSPNEHPYNLESVLGNLHESLSGFSDDDYLVLVGSPILLGCAAAIAARYNEGRVSFLQWSAKENDYIKIAGAIF